jgi:translation initiation factor 5B
MLRQVIVTMMGNVDSGKSQTIDTIKRTSIVKSEPGKITQTIKAYNISMDAIKKISGNLIDTSKIKIPGMLFLDTPGHASFSNLRKRGGSLADIAVLIVDFKDGIKPQTAESIEILKESKTPFIVAVNKVDLIPGWKTNHSSLLQNINSQDPALLGKFEEKFYQIVGDFHEKGVAIDRFDRVEDYTKTFAAIPISAKTGEGIPELLMVLSGLAQKFLENNLESDIEGPAKGTVLEVLEEKGLGKTLDTIIYDGKIKKGDQVIIGTLEEPLITKVKGLFIPDGKKLKAINEAHAAIGIKISCQETDKVISGMPLVVIQDNLEEAKEEIQSQIQETTFELNEEGIVIKADSIGSMEALIESIQEKGIKIKRASIGNISKKDLVEAEADNNPINRILLGFRVPKVESDTVKVICNDVIYTILDDIEKYIEEKTKEIQAEALKGIAKPCKVKIMPNCIFRQSNPAVVGVEILEGTLKPGINMMKDDLVFSLKSVEANGKSLSEAKEGLEVAISIPHITAGRQIKEGDTLYVSYTEDEFRKIKKLQKLLKEGEVQILKEIAEIKRKNNSMWGIG